MYPYFYADEDPDAGRVYRPHGTTHRPGYTQEASQNPLFKLLGSISGGPAWKRLTQHIKEGDFTISPEVLEALRNDPGTPQALKQKLGELAGAKVRFGPDRTPEYATKHGGARRGITHFFPPENPQEPSQAPQSQQPEAGDWDRFQQFIQDLKGEFGLQNNEPTGARVGQYRPGMRPPHQSFRTQQNVDADGYPTAAQPPPPPQQGRGDQPSFVDTRLDPYGNVIDSDGNVVGHRNPQTGFVTVSPPDEPLSQTGPYGDPTHPYWGTEQDSDDTLSYVPGEGNFEGAQIGPYPQHDDDFQLVTPQRHGYTPPDLALEGGQDPYPEPDPQGIPDEGGWDDTTFRNRLITQGLPASGAFHDEAMRRLTQNGRYSNHEGHQMHYGFEDDLRGMTAEVHQNPLEVTGHHALADFLAENDRPQDAKFRQDLAGVIGARLNSPWVDKREHVGSNGMPFNPSVRGFSEHNIPSIHTWQPEAPNALWGAGYTHTRLRPGYTRPFHDTPRAWRWAHSGSDRHEGDPLAAGMDPDMEWGRLLAARAPRPFDAGNLLDWEEWGRTTALTPPELAAFDFTDLPDVDPALWPQVEAILRQNWDRFQQFADDEAPTEYADFPTRLIADTPALPRLRKRRKSGDYYLFEGDEDPTDYNLAEQRAWLEQIGQNWDEGTAHGAYGDWLEEHGDPREAAFRRALAQWLQTGPTERNVFGEVLFRGHAAPEWFDFAGFPDRRQLWAEAADGGRELTMDDLAERPARFAPHGDPEYLNWVDDQRMEDSLRDQFHANRPGPYGRQTDYAVGDRDYFASNPLDLQALEAAQDWHLENDNAAEAKFLAEAHPWLRDKLTNWAGPPEVEEGIPVKGAFPGGLWWPAVHQTPDNDGAPLDVAHTLSPRQSFGDGPEAWWWGYNPEDPFGFPDSPEKLVKLFGLKDTGADHMGNARRRYTDTRLKTLTPVERLYGGLVDPNTASPKEWADLIDMMRARRQELGFFEDDDAPTEYGEQDVLQAEIARNPLNVDPHLFLADELRESGDTAEGDFREQVGRSVQRRLENKWSPVSPRWTPQNPSALEPRIRSMPPGVLTEALPHGPLDPFVRQVRHPAVRWAGGFSPASDRTWFPEWSTVHQPNAWHWLRPGPLTGAGPFEGGEEDDIARPLTAAERFYAGIENLETVDPRLWPQIEALMRQQGQRGVRFADDGAPTAYGDAEDEAAHIRQIHSDPFELTGHLSLADWYADRDRPADEAFRRNLAQGIERRLNTPWKAAEVDEAGWIGHDAPHGSGARPTIRTASAPSHTGERNIVWRHPVLSNGDWTLNEHPEGAWSWGIGELERFAPHQDDLAEMLGLGVGEDPEDWTHPFWLRSRRGHFGEEAPAWQLTELLPEERLWAGIDDWANMDPRIWPQLEALLRRQHGRGERLARGEAQTNYGPSFDAGDDLTDHLALADYLAEQGLLEEAAARQRWAMREQSRWDEVRPGMIPGTMGYPGQAPDDFLPGGELPVELSRYGLTSRNRSAYSRHPHTEYAMGTNYADESTVQSLMAQLAAAEMNAHRWGHDPAINGLRGILADALDDVGRPREAQLLRTEGRHVMVSPDGRIVPGRFNHQAALDAAHALLSRMSDWNAGDYPLPEFDVVVPGVNEGYYRTEDFGDPSDAAMPIPPGHVRLVDIDPSGMELHGLEHVPYPLLGRALADRLESHMSMFDPLEWVDDIDAAEGELNEGMRGLIESPFEDEDPTALSRYADPTQDLEPGMQEPDFYARELPRNDNGQLEGVMQPVDNETFLRGHFGPKPAPSPMNYGDRELFEAEIAREPRNVDPHLMLADWHREQGDVPEGDFREAVGRSVQRRLQNPWAPPKERPTRWLPELVQPNPHGSVDPFQDFNRDHRGRLFRATPHRRGAGDWQWLGALMPLGAEEPDWDVPTEDDLYAARQSGPYPGRPDEWSRVWDLFPAERVYAGIDDLTTMPPELWPLVEQIMRQQHERGLKFEDTDDPLDYVYSRDVQEWPVQYPPNVRPDAPLQYNPHLTSRNRNAYSTSSQTEYAMPNMNPFGYPIKVGDFEFPPDTPRGVLADAFQDAGHPEYPARLRSDDPHDFDEGVIRWPEMEIADYLGVNSDVYEDEPWTFGSGPFIDIDGADRLALTQDGIVVWDNNRMEWYEMPAHAIDAMVRRLAGPRRIKTPEADRFKQWVRHFYDHQFDE